MIVLAATRATGLLVWQVALAGLGVWAVTVLWHRHGAPRLVRWRHWRREGWKAVERGEK